MNLFYFPSSSLSPRCSARQSVLVGLLLSNCVLAHAARTSGSPILSPTSLSYVELLSWSGRHHCGCPKNCILLVRKLLISCRRRFGTRAHTTRAISKVKWPQRSMRASESELCIFQKEKKIGTLSTVQVLRWRYATTHCPIFFSFSNHCPTVQVPRQSTCNYAEAATQHCVTA